MKHQSRTSFLIVFLIIFISIESHSSNWEFNGEYYVNKTALPSVDFLRISKDGTKFFTYTRSEQLFRTWDYESGEVIDTVKLPKVANSGIDLSPDEKYVVYWWTVEVGREIWEGYFVKWDLNKKDEVFSKELGIQEWFEIKGEPEYVWPVAPRISVRFTPNGKNVLTVFNGRCPYYEGIFNGGFCDLWDSENGEFVSRLVDDNVNGIGYSNDMEHLAYQIWTYFSHKIRYMEYDWTTHLAITLDNNTILNNNPPDTDGREFTKKIFFSHDSKKLCVVGDIFELYNTDDASKIQREYKYKTYRKATYGMFSKCNKYIITSDNYDLTFFDANLGVPAKKYNNVSVSGISLHPDSTSFLLSPGTGTICLFKPYMFFNNLYSEFWTEKRQLHLKNSEIKFYDISGGDPTEWQWDFGDGYTSTEQHPIHKYKAPGIYSIRLIVGDDQNNKDTIIKENYYEVLPDLICDFQVTPLRGQAPRTIYLINKSSGDIKNVSWDIGSFHSNEHSPSVNFETPGTYDVRLRIWDKISDIELLRKNYVYIESQEEKQAKTDRTLFLKGDGLCGLRTVQTSDYTYFLLSESKIKETLEFQNVSVELPVRHYYLVKLDSNLNYQCESLNYKNMLDYRYEIKTTVVNSFGCGYFDSSYYFSDKNNLLKMKALSDNNKIDSVFLAIHPFGIKSIYRLENGDLIFTNAYNNKVELSRYNSEYHMFSRIAYPYNFNIRESYRESGQEFADPLIKSFRDNILLVVDNEKVIFIDKDGEIFNKIEPWKDKTLHDDFSIIDFMQLDSKRILFLYKYDDPFRPYRILMSDTSGIDIWEMKINVDGHNIKNIYALCELPDEKIIVAVSTDSLDIVFLTYDYNGQLLTQKVLENKKGEIRNLFVNRQNELVATGYIIKNNVRYAYIAKYDINSLTTNVNDNYIEEINSKIITYPNPFTESNTISYILEKAAFVKMELYDMQGNKMSTIKDMFTQAGRYSETINTNELPTGTYIYKILIDGKLSTEKVIKIANH